MSSSQRTKKCVEILAEKGMCETLGPEDFVDCEVVVQEEKTGTNIGRPSTLYREDRFFVHFPDAKKRKSLSFCIGTIGNQKWYRVFDFEDGVLRCENYTDNSIGHKKTIEDGSLRLSEDQVANSYRNAVDNNFNDTRHAKAMTSADLGKAAGSAGPSASSASAKQKELRAQKSDESSGSGSMSSNEEAAPLIKSSLSLATGVKKKAVKAKAKAKDNKQPEVFRDTDDEAKEDAPQTKTDQAFLKATNFKVRAAQQVVDHVAQAQALKEIDDAWVASSIRQLDGKTNKIVECGLVKLKGQVAKLLIVLRGLSKLVKTVRAFEQKCGVVGKQAEAAALMTTGFETFKDCKCPLASLPWCMRIALLSPLLNLAPLPLLVVRIVVVAVVVVVASSGVRIVHLVSCLRL